MGLIEMGEFHLWLRKQTQRQDPVGDLARDMLRDREAMACRTLSALDRHLSGLGVSGRVMDARDRAWREFREAIDQASWTRGAPKKMLALRRCVDCGKPCWADYMVWSHVWRAAGMKSDGGKLHIWCLENRLARPVELGDFSAAPINEVLLHVLGSVAHR